MIDFKLSQTSKGAKLYPSDENSRVRNNQLDKREEFKSSKL